ncbi:MAG: HsdR family type I site-specific deoxyribonuclease [Candidatus Thiodiazotropha lotti]|nr:HsdR family type I site-specific deoxyribonuclease [Candidatus Thiodiazotropha lotti]MCG8001897.1 HsdR family type I site-specific deoxyribonuclease [Candidatus Thiodiazotropha lotti]MCG8009667.1 HsdR family type I site-specific deoxyribonuclease [Candidatus Thiodiazotropha lotti]MCW4185515.1 HsdR family type I site-specific deoxyribonuclease [Candidatus Thiodiazotropha lotti]MCW4197260.1 HsdR family type I site-specific deoxyribonuclease [Candidatus Thiodiazotropha lotti]
MAALPEIKEQYSSHIPALKTLLALGWDYLSPTDCLNKRGDNRSVVLKDELIESLKKRCFEYKGETYPLSPNAIEQIVRELVSPGLNEGLLSASQRLYDKLCLGVTVTEFIDGKKHAPTIPIIDWDDLANNSLLVTEEMTVLSTSGTHTRRPDIVAFVNGLPLVVIEAKRPDGGNPNKRMTEEGISQTLRNQRGDEIPHLFVYAQLLLAISGTDGRYGATGTIKKFWACWQDEEFSEDHFHKIKNRPLKPETVTALFADKPEKLRRYFAQLWAGEELPNEQDRLLISLLTPSRLLEFVRYFMLYDRKVGKIAARYPQAFGIKALIKRVNQRAPGGGREGGVLWHTTGSGKSFTMVLLCKALLLHPSLKDCRIVVVTDRVDLEKQLANTFLSGGAFGSIIAAKKEGEKAKARSGKDLAKRIGQGSERIIFAIINKFNNASKQPECYNPSDKLIVLIDEGHRSQGGENHERMRKSLPNAAYIAFTGTPLLKNDKTTNKFGPILHAYTMQRAVEDGTVTPLLYEERQPELTVNDKAIDNWFDKITVGLTDEQKTDLKKKYARKGEIYKSSNRIELIAWDIALHFNENIKKLGLGLKGQIACDSKSSAIRYKQCLDATELVSSAVVISPPDSREGNEAVDESKIPLVQKWWKAHVGHDAEGYERAVLTDFGEVGDPDLLIVVDKLLTGFDEPRNTVLYIDKPLKEHNLIQAIARVNRLHEEKQYGLLIDYRGILEELDSAIEKFQDLASRTQGGYDIDDIDGLYHQMSAEYKQLPRLHDRLWSIFARVKNRRDLEQFRQVLIPDYQEDSDGNSYDARQKVRDDFYAALTEFGLCLKLALSSRSFFEDASFSEATIQTYKDDLRFFFSLRKTARQDAQETVDYSSYEAQIRRLVDKQVVGNEVKEPKGVYVVSELGQEEPESWSEEKTRNETDLIRTRIKKTIEQELAGDPYAQQVFSELLKQAIAEAEALFDHPLKQYALFKSFEKKVEAKDVEGIPGALDGNPHAKAYYGVMRLVLGAEHFSDDDPVKIQPFVDEALAIDQMVDKAVAEHSLNPQSIEAEIRKGLLPRLFKLFGMEKAKTIIEEVIQITRVGLNHRA